MKLDAKVASNLLKLHFYHTIGDDGGDEMGIILKLGETSMWKYNFYQMMKFAFGGACYTLQPRSGKKVGHRGQLTRLMDLFDGKSSLKINKLF